jgi:CubicO group peptidase (beta-lactamase class C family)
VLYVVLGQLIEEVTGKTWEEYVASEVLARGGMTDSTVDLRGALRHREPRLAPRAGQRRDPRPRSEQCA